jgi:hypothetical protein
VTAAGPGGTPLVRVFDGATGAPLAAFFAYHPAFTGGLFVGCGDVSGDGVPDIVTGADAGGAPHVIVFDGVTNAPIRSFFAYDTGFVGGVRVAACDFNGDGRADIVTVPGPSGNPHVRVFDGATGADLAGFFAYDPRFTGGAFLACGDVSGDGVPDIVTGADAGGAPHVLVFDGLSGLPIFSFFPYDLGFVGGARVAVCDLTRDGYAEIVTAPGAPSGPQVNVLDSATHVLLDAFFALEAGFLGGVYVGCSPELSARPTFTSAAAAAFQAGVPSSFVVTTAGTPPVTRIVQTGPLPAGIAFTDRGDGTALLDGTALAGTGGTYALTFAASNGVTTPGTQQFTLTVGEAPAITSAPAVTFALGLAASFTVTTTGFPTPGIARSGALPAGITFADNGNGTGTLAGTPGPGTGGIHPLVFTATNGVGASAVQPFTLTVSGAPTITSPAAATFALGGFGTFTVTTDGFPAPAIARGGVALPGGVSFTDNGNGTGTLSGVPGAGTAGTYALTFTATNTGGSSPVQSFTLTVQQAPAITSPGAAAFTVGTPNVFVVTTTGAPPPAIARSGALPGGVTFTDNGNGTATLAGTPAPAGVGSYPLTFTATNVAGSAMQPFTLGVACPVITVGPAAPALPDGTYQAPYSQTFTAAGGTPPHAFTTADPLPTGVTLGAATGLLAGPPTATGSFAFTVTATDAAGCTGTGSYTLVVRPVVRPDTYSGGVGNTQFVVGATPPATPHVFVAGSVLDNDGGPGPLTATLVTPPGHGSVVLNPDGTFVYTPEAGYAGPADSFTYAATDGGGTGATALVTIQLSRRVWYVNSDFVGASDGRSHLPFTTLNQGLFHAGPSPASVTTDVVYVHDNALDYVESPFPFPNGVTLHGQGAPLTVNGLTIPAGSAPEIRGTVGVGLNTTLRGLTLRSLGGPALSGFNFGLLTITDTSIDGGPGGIFLQDGTLAATLTTVSASGPAASINLTNVSGNLAIGTTTITDHNGFAILINISDAAVSFGNTTIVEAIGIGAGVSLFGNDGSVAFDSLNVSLLSGPGLTADSQAGAIVVGGGAISAQFESAVLVHGSLAVPTPLAIALASVTWNGGPGSAIVPAIDLRHTSGSFTVTGAGGLSGSGGTIQNTEIGVDLQSATNVTLAHMNFLNANTLATGCAPDSAFGCFAAIRAFVVEGLTLRGLHMSLGAGAGLAGHSIQDVAISDTTIENFGTGATPGTGAVKLSELSGTATITSSTFATSDDRALEITTDGPLDLAIAGTTITDAGHGIRVRTNGTVTMSITGSQITGITAADGILLGAGPSGTLHATVSGNTIGMNLGAGAGIHLQADGTLCANVTGNAVTPAGAAFRVEELGAGAIQLQGFVTNATLTWNGNGNTPLGSVVEVGAAAAGTCATFP